MIQITAAYNLSLDLSYATQFSVSNLKVLATPEKPVSPLTIPPGTDEIRGSVCCSSKVCLVLLFFGNPGHCMHHSVRCFEVHHDGKFGANHPFLDTRNFEGYLSWKAFLFLLLFLVVMALRPETRRPVVAILVFLVVRFWHDSPRSLHAATA